MAQQQTWQWSTRTTVVSTGSESLLYGVAKRSIDILLATALIIVLLPLLLLIALLVKLDSPGPVIFTQERVGARRQRYGRLRFWVVRNFTFYKFRSMVRDADSSLHEAYIKEFVEGRAQPSAESGGKFKLVNDPRVTRIGRFLRKFSLDELPQLCNVLKGDMSLVGPRPVPTYEVARYQARHHNRFAALPGITGWWQVKGRCRVSFEEMIRMDLDYIRDASVWLDLKILFLTVPAVLSKRGAE
jgi:lipopolysaccharide/colanic/teichoic acid biosynthesis glycosyltransferase